MAAHPFRDRIAIVGVGQTPFSRQGPEPELVLAVQAVGAAIEDAGLERTSVDGLASFTMETTSELALAKALGFDGAHFFAQVGYGGGAACGAVGLAALGVASGQCEVAVAWRSRKRSGAKARPWAQVTAAVPREQSARGIGDWYRPWGLLRPADEIAMLARRYMHEFGATRQHFANIALACRAHANRNPAAVMHDRELTRDGYMTSRWISEPLCINDCCLETDGAAAVVITTVERARDCRHEPVLVHAFAQGFRDDQSVMTNYHAVDPLHGPSWTCAEALWRQAALGPADVDVVQIYDAFTPLVPLSLEGYGFCGRGEGAAFTEDGALEWPKGRLPLNTSGGSLSEGYLHGFNLVTEAVRQMRGTSTAQVDGARTALVTSAEGVPSSALLLRRG